MTYDRPAKAVFRQSVTERDYLRARMICAQRAGALRFAYPVGLLGAALMALGIWTWVRDITELAYIVTMAGFVIAGLLLILTFFVWLPRDVRRRATADYHTYHRLLEPSQAALFADTFELGTDTLSVTESYARVRLCVETPTAFVLIRDRDYAYILLKTAMTERVATEEFLRLTFARKLAKG